MLLFLPLLAGGLMLLAAIVAGRWFVAADPQKLARTLRSGGNFGLILVGIVLVLRGNLTLGGSLVALGAGRLLGRTVGGLGAPGGASRGPGPGRASTVRTNSLEASLDHDSGDMDAKVTQGPFAGRTLSALGRVELYTLWRDFDRSGEEDSRLLVEAYLDRRHPAWREDVEADADAGSSGARRAGRPGSGAMTEQEAYEVLGVAPGASEAEIRAAHRRLMKEVHPDQGGSARLAAQLNEARDVLLGRR